MASVLERAVHLRRTLWQLRTNVPDGTNWPANQAALLRSQLRSLMPETSVTA